MYGHSVPAPTPHADKTSRGRWPRVLLAAVLTLGLAGALFAQAATPANAVCRFGPCAPDEPTGITRPPTTTAPIVTRVSSISPSFGWSGDLITLDGTGFSGASVTVNGAAAQITSTGSTQLRFLVPPLVGLAFGQASVPVVVSSPTGSATTSLTPSSSIQVSAWSTYGINAQFNQGTDGQAWATATVDRLSGFSNTTLTVQDTQFWRSLSINAAVVLLDSNDKVIGFTPVYNVTATGVVLHWPSAESYNSQTFPDTIKPSPAIGPNVHSARLLLVRDYGTEFQTTLQTAVTVGQTIGQVVQTLAAFV